MEVNRDHQLFGYPYSLKYIILCSAEEINFLKRGFVNDDRIFIFGELSL